MRYRVTLERVETLEIEVEAESIEDADWVASGIPYDEWCSMSYEDGEYEIEEIYEEED